ncbi:MAG: 2-C-methyl-D-erythritol 4-phosphate cytidylyltransferase [Rubrobacter sp.]|nr:2-C-methyl-D-erythritol 4-phosphate cytidylyltransferase [Rubrobacter sp.]
MGRPKQFIEVGGAPALLHTLRAFEESPGVRRIYTVGDGPRIGELSLESGITKYAGCASTGASRPLSTRSGLSVMDEPPETLVLIHDGSRCLVTPELVERVIEAAEGETGGAILALPVSDTVKAVEDGYVSETLERSTLYAVQTPQAFRLGELREVYGAAGEALHGATDDASLFENAGRRVRVIRGEKTNIKLTDPSDLLFAEAILGSRAGDRRGVRG